MDFSINKLHKANNNLQFTGLEGALNKKSSFVYKFIPPAHKSNEEVYLEISYLESDPETKGAKKPDEKKFIERKFNGNSPIEISQEILKKESPFGIAYRYKIVNKNGEVRYEQDPFRTMKINNKGDRMNVIEHKNFYGVSPKGGTMRHSFLDSDVRLKGDKMVTAADRDFVRNHFNKLGGSIKGLTYLLNNTDELEPYRYIMTTPDIGADKVSSHRYWPSNQYQCNNLQDFKDFNFELFKKGKGYIADGAFTSQGIQSPLVQHVLKWGEDSPFYNMLKVDGFITLGVLPDIRPDGEAVNPYEHIGVRIVNNPNNKDYDANKSTYIQFFDDRLLSEEKQNDTKNLHFDYDSAPQDHYEITSHQDSVQPYAFEIDAKDKK